MSQESINPKIKAVISIRKAVLTISNQSNELKEIARQLEVKVEKAHDLFMEHTSSESQDVYLETIEKYKTSVSELKSILNSVIGLINNREVKNLTITWDRHITYSNEVKYCLNTLYQLGINNLDSVLNAKWIAHWTEIFDAYDEIDGLSDSCRIGLVLIESCAPEEIDDFTQTLLSHIPFNYSVDEAEQYEKEYLEAYEELKRQASQKKNLWDRILDALAGGTQTSPAQMVKMNRWVNGEKGNL